jgi:FtsP/CotA-like multicopper oxidase with cupredoxin domain
MYRINRRQLMLTAGAASILPVRGVFADTGPDVLRAEACDVQLLPQGYGPTTLWGFNGTAPGPEIRVGQGERVVRRLQNALTNPTSIHWHGIRIENAMDGVSGLTQEAVQPGTDFTYDFVAPDAGTFWYHAHHRSTEQVARGLYGALIVEEANGPDIDREEVLVLDDWQLDPETSQLHDDFFAMHDLSHAGRLGNYITTNGVYNLSLATRRHERLRLRIINASNARIFPLRLDGVEGWMVALDGMPLSTPQPVNDPFVLAPAQRIDLIVDVIAEVGETAHLVHLGRDEAFSQVAFEVGADASLSRRDPPEALPANRVSPLDLSEAVSLTLKMEGGAMGGMGSATLNGQPRSMRDIVDAGRFWAFNGAADGMAGEPLARLALGDALRLKIQNETAFPHAMHLHGMHFHEMLDDGTLGPLRDTTLVDRRSSRDIAFVADNPGRWLLHCHMLSHAAAGMTTQIVVT